MSGGKGILCLSHNRWVIGTTCGDGEEEMGSVSLPLPLKILFFSLVNSKFFA